MQKTIFLDAGNSRLKAAVFDDHIWKPAGQVEYDVSEKVFLAQLENLVRPYHRLIIASVKHFLNRAVLQKISSVDIVEINRSNLPLERIRYRTPEELGVDRLLACIGAWKQSRSPVIVTDAGTACTVDIMNEKGWFLGGVIMPGLRTMISTLGNCADGLREVEPGLPVVWPPETTESALQAGSSGTFLAAWHDHIKRSMEQFPGAQIWLTGGDAGFIETHSTHPCIVHEYLVFEGMRQWLALQQ